jgi:hypothetical protein
MKIGVSGLEIKQQVRCIFEFEAISQAALVNARIDHLKANKVFLLV